MFDKYARRAISGQLKKYDHFAGENDFIEVTEWNNLEGFDVNISAKTADTLVQFTDGQFDLITALVRELRGEASSDVDTTMLIELLEGAAPIVSMFVTETEAQRKWKESWLRNWAAFQRALRLRALDELAAEGQRLGDY
jgi:hypothetical protein